MYKCIIIHNMVVNEKRTLSMLPERERGGSSRIVASDEVKCCFVRDATVHRPIKRTVVALCATHHYLHLAYEYMNLWRLNYKRVMSERTDK